MAATANCSIVKHVTFPYYEYYIKGADVGFSQLSEQNSILQRNAGSKPPQPTFNKVLINVGAAVIIAAATLPTT